MAAGTVVAEAAAPVEVVRNGGAAGEAVKARLSRRSDGAVLWQEDLYRSETYAASLDKNLQQEGESLAARVIARRIAEDIVSRLLTDF